MSHQIIVDWLQFTIHDRTFSEVIVSILKYEYSLFQQLPKGKLGYKKQVAYENISVLYEGNKDMGVHVILSGKGCRLFETKESILNLIDRVNEYNGKLTRIDIALDDFVGDLIPFKKIKADIVKGNIVTKWKSSIEITKRDTDGNLKGETISLGSRTSNTFLRIYDKALEQNTDGVWNRLEIEIKKSNAEEVQKILNVYTASAILKGVLNNYLRIVEPNPTDTNKSRWVTKKYWLKIINDIDKIKLTRKKEEKSVDQIKEWIKKQVGPSMAVVSILENGDNTFFQEVINDAIEEMKPKHQRLIMTEIHKRKQMKEELEELKESYQMKKELEQIEREIYRENSRGNQHHDE